MTTAGDERGTKLQPRPEPKAESPSGPEPILLLDNRTLNPIHLALVGTEC